MSTSKPSTSQFLVDELGKYVVVEEIAEGTFGKVKKAIHSVTQHRVAMKYIQKEVIRQTKTKTRVQREIDYMRMLRHPHIIKLYEVISTQEDIIIVLEYAGGELFNYIVNNGRMAEPQARRIFQQIISGVEYSHRLKIVHRDLKPENVLLDDDNNVKLADYGLSNQFTEGEFLKTSCGSPNYAAPEVIRGGFYSGPEVDVWSAGVILYVMLCGRLPFEDDNVQQLFQQISQGRYHIPAHLSADAKELLAGMLCVEPMKRMSVLQVTQSRFYQKDLPQYLKPIHVPSGPLLGPLSKLVAPPSLDYEMIDGLGRMEETIVKQLAGLLSVDKEEIWDALRKDDGVQSNSVKVAYMLLRDKSRLGKDLAEYEEREREAQARALDPANPLSPLTLSPGGTDGSEQNVFDIQFADDPDSDIDSEDDSSEPSDYEFSLDTTQEPNFSILETSLPSHGQAQKSPEPAASPHPLAAFANAKSRSSGKEKKAHRTRWHFGIRSRSPPMEVMAEIYRTLNTLGMEWKQKKDLGGLGGNNWKRPQADRAKLDRAKEWDSYRHPTPRINEKAAQAIYLVEARIRVDDIVVRMNLQLYQVDDVNYLVDFHHKRSYKASKAPHVNKFEMAHPRAKPIGRVTAPHEKHGEDAGTADVRDHDVVSPFIFMDVACRLIIELAGGSE